MTCPFGALVRGRLEPTLRDLRGVQAIWSESSGGWTHLEVRPDVPTGFLVAMNVGPEYALVIAGGSLSRQFDTPPRAATAAEAEPYVTALAELVLALLGRDMRVRELRAGRATFRWLLERRDEGGAWRRVARWYSILPWRYFGRRTEVVYANRTRSRSRVAG